MKRYTSFVTKFNSCSNQTHDFIQESTFTIQPILKSKGKELINHIQFWSSFVSIKDWNHYLEVLWSDEKHKLSLMFVKSEGLLVYIKLS